MTSLEGALRQALVWDGIAVLDEPQRLASYVRDLCEYDDLDASAFVANCNAQLLRGFAQAAREGDRALLTRARDSACALLRSDGALSVQTSEGIAGALQLTVGRHIGLLAEEAAADGQSEATSDDFSSPGGKSQAADRSKPLQDVLGRMPPTAKWVVAAIGLVVMVSFVVPVYNAFLYYAHVPTLLVTVLMVGAIVWFRRRHS